MQNPTEPELCQAILAHTDALYVVTDETGRLTYSSPAAVRVLGCEPEERIGASVYDLIHPEDVDGQRVQLARVLEDDEAAFSGEFRARHRDGAWRVLEGTALNLLDDPAIAGILITLRDVTELRRAEAELDRARVLLQEVVAHVPVVLQQYLRCLRRGAGGTRAAASGARG